MPRIVIVGGGFGGLNVAKALRGAPAHVTVIDKYNHHVFQPLLYQVATAGLSATSIAQPLRHLLNADNIEVKFGEACDVDLESQTVCLRDEARLPYDRLVLAAGANTNWFGNEKWRDIAYGLKSADDAIRLRERLLWCFEAADRTDDPALREQYLTFLVVGGGPTGVEMAGALMELGRRVLSHDFRSICPTDVRVILAEMKDRVLSPFDADLSERAHLDLEELGVEVRLNTKLVALEESGAATLEFSAGESTQREVVCTGAVCWAPGVEPNDLLSSQEVDRRGGRLVVDTYCRLPAASNVYCIGDMAHQRDEKGDPLPGLAAVAQQQGRYLGKSLARWADGKTVKPFRYRDKGLMATIGRSRAVVQAGALKLRGYVAWLAWGVAHILLMVGLRNRTVVFIDWLWQYATDRRGARLLRKDAEHPVHGVPPLSAITRRTKPEPTGEPHQRAS